MAVPVYPFIVALLGAALYLISNHPKASELGRIAFFVGLLVAVWTFAPHVVIR
jgi:hypothetical protein